MAREKEGYRDTLAALSEAFPGKGALSRTEVAAFLGVTPRTVQRWVTSGRLKWPATLPRIAIADLARQVCCGR